MATQFVPFDKKEEKGKAPKGKPAKGKAAPKAKDSKKGCK